MTSAIPINTAMMHPLTCSSRTHVLAHDLHTTVDRAFINALLLTASVERAEAAIVKGARVDLGKASGGTLLRDVMTAALEPRCDTPEHAPEQLERASCILPR